MNFLIYSMKIWTCKLFYTSPSTFEESSILLLVFESWWSENSKKFFDFWKNAIRLFLFLYSLLHDFCPRNLKYGFFNSARPCDWKDFGFPSVWILRSKMTKFVYNTNLSTSYSAYFFNSPTFIPAFKVSIENYSNERNIQKEIFPMFIFHWNPEAPQTPKTHKHFYWFGFWTHLSPKLAAWFLPSKT